MGARLGRGVADAAVSAAHEEHRDGDAGPASTCASWPAPDGRDGAPAAARPRTSRSLRRRRPGRCACSASSWASQPCAARGVSAAVAPIAPRGRPGGSASGARASTRTVVPPGDDVRRPRLHLRLADPTVATASSIRPRRGGGSDLEGRRAQRRVAAAPHRRRAGMAGSAARRRPRSSRMPTIEVTTPSAASRPASTGPCSMCASTNAAGAGTSQPPPGANGWPPAARACAHA